MTAWRKFSLSIQANLPKVTYDGLKALRLASRRRISVPALILLALLNLVSGTYRLFLDRGGALHGRQPGIAFGARKLLAHEVDKAAHLGRQPSPARVDHR